MNSGGIGRSIPDWYCHCDIQVRVETASDDLIFLAPRYVSVALMRLFVAPSPVVYHYEVTFVSLLIERPCLGSCLYLAHSSFYIVW